MSTGLDEEKERRERKELTRVNVRGMEAGGKRRCGRRQTRPHHIRSRPQLILPVARGIPCPLPIPVASIPGHLSFSFPDPFNKTLVSNTSQSQSEHDSTRMPFFPIFFCLFSSKMPHTASESRLRITSSELKLPMSLVSTSRIAYESRQKSRHHTLSATACDLRLEDQSVTPKR